MSTSTRETGATQMFHVIYEQGTDGPGPLTRELERSRLIRPVTLCHGLVLNSAAL
jgi:hypothetical protein